MNDYQATILCMTALAGAGTAGYMTYVVITHADGIAMASFVGFLTAIGTAVVSKLYHRKK